MENKIKTSEGVELINLLDSESNQGVGHRVCCPKCSHDSVVKKSHQVDIPKAIGFLFFLGASFAIVLAINLIILIREKMKYKKLPQGIKEKVKENKISLLGLHIPTKTKIECSKCQYVFFENYDMGDFIVVFVFFFIVILVVLLTVYFYLKFK